MMMAILDTFSWLPFFAEPQNPDAFVFTFVLMLGVCVCDVGFSNTRQWLMVLEHPEQSTMLPASLHLTATVQPNPQSPSEVSVFGEPYTWSNNTQLETENPTSTSNALASVPLNIASLSDKQVEDHFFVGGTFFGLPLSTNTLESKTTVQPENTTR
jgi:hypothetical protein